MASPRLLLLAALLVATPLPVHAWVSATQQGFGTSVAQIRNESFGLEVPGATPDSSLGLLWTLPLRVEEQVGLGGGSITWAWDKTLCDALLPKFNENFWVFSLINCDSLHASAHRAFDTWAANSRHIKFTEVSAKCDAAGKAAASCPYARIALVFNATSATPVVSVRKEEQSVAFRYTDGQEALRGFGTPGKGYFEVHRPVQATVGGTIGFRADGVCWYADSQFCAPLHEWKRAWSTSSAYYTGAAFFFSIWGLIVIAVAYDFGMRFKRTTRAHEMLLRADGPTEHEEIEKTEMRAVAMFAVFAHFHLRTLTLRIFLILMPWAYFHAIFQVCWKCFDFEAAMAHNIGHLLGLGNPDLVPKATNSYHAGYAAGGAARVNGSTCQGDLWGDVRSGVPPGALLDPLTDVRPSIMQEFTLHTPRSCLQPDDMEALNVLYPDCQGGATTPICAKPALNLGWLRLIVFFFGPLVVAFILAVCLYFWATLISERSRSATLAAEEAAKAAKKAAEAEAAAGE